MIYPELVAMIRKCLKCGKEFKTYPSKLKVGRGKYCSKLCSDQVTLIKKGQHLGVSTQFGNITPYNKKGWRYTSAGGNRQEYKEVYSPSHPNATQAGYVREHRLVVEKHIGRYLNDCEIVHHIDGNTLNNDINNLELMDKKDHDRMNTPLNIHRRWYANT